MAIELPEKALSVKQPWAWAICAGIKDVENRTKPTRHRGPVLIHASLSKPWTDVEDAIEWIEDGEIYDACRDEPRRVEVPRERLVTGAIVGLVEICGSLPPGQGSGSDWAIEDQHHWLLKNAYALARPVPCKGKLGLWRPAEDLLDRVQDSAKRVGLTRGR
jgi:hypothetical protein